MNERHPDMCRNVFFLRSLIIATAIIHVSLFAYWFLFFDSTKDNLEVLWSYAGVGSVFDIPELAWWLYVGIWYVSLAGLFALMNWARWVFLSHFLVGLVLTSTSGIHILTPWEAVSVDLMNASAGAIIAVMFFSPMKAKFLNI
jgi:hypothetical protein